MSPAQSLKARRQFLKTIATTGVGGTGMAALDHIGLLERMGAAASDALVSSAQAQTAEDYRCMVCLFMFGGNDANNLLIPTDAGRFGQYQRARRRFQRRRRFDFIFDATGFG